ncbi:MAG TPA: aminoacyl-tRNA hydrolase [Hyphomicrobiales bacterium]|nr:aminoacyl-tRNA hydrolase [Rhodobiaceae bacterium]HXK53513.1 aminoacyl-tRNA hydrolase [Hyphomicrobiales bacterium]
MLILVGLGNPGERYAQNRHNVGFMALDAIHARHGFSPWRSRFQGQCAEGLLGRSKCLLLKPMTYMNESGRSVGEAMRFFKLGPDAVTVIHDEIDLAAGKLRVKTGGGMAGHNGLRSIANHIGPDFVRVRVGVGHPGAREQVHGHVLRDFAKADAAWLEPMIEAIAGNAALLARGDGAGFMNKIALALGGEGDKQKKPAEKPARGEQSE